MALTFAVTRPPARGLMATSNSHGIRALSFESWRSPSEHILHEQFPRARPPVHRHQHFCHSGQSRIDDRAKHGLVRDFRSSKKSTMILKVDLIIELNTMRSRSPICLEIPRRLVTRSHDGTIILHRHDDLDGAVHGSVPPQQYHLIGSTLEQVTGSGTIMPSCITSSRNRQ